MQYKRLISEAIQRAAAHFPALVLTGARQVGKTTLLRSLFPKHSYVSLDLPGDAELAESDPATFLRRYPPPVVIDEVQYAPKLFRYLKIAIDADRHVGGRFVLTGSQRFTLMREVSDSLAGRIAVFELEPLTVHELQDDFSRLCDMQGVAAALARGFYPQLWADPALPREDFYRSYIATYLERDVRQILNVASLRDFSRFMRVCATRTAQIINKSDIAKDVGISTKTANAWLGILQASNQIVLLEPYFSNPGKRIVKSPKLYFTDPGLASYLLGLSADTVAGSPHIGHLWETFVFAELRRYLGVLRPEATLWFYRDTQRECDFVVAWGGRLSFMDAKWKQHPTEHDFAHVRTIRSYFDHVHDTPLICATATHDFPVAGVGRVVTGFGLHAWVRSGP